MIDYEKRVKALRCAGLSKQCDSCDYGYHLYEDSECNDACDNEMLDRDAADAIEALQAEVKRLKEANDELREAQTYIDHYGDRWMTSAKDVPTSAYEHGYADGRDEAEAQLLKRGKWVYNDGDYIPYCSICGMPQDTETPYCHFCGAKMEAQDDKV